MSGRTSVQACPQRTCVGCRGRAAKAELLRVVAVEGPVLRTVVPDPRGRRAGRGAYLHPRPDCLDSAERRKAFARAFRRPGSYDLGEVRRYLDAGAAGAGTGPEPGDGAAGEQ